MQKSYILYGPQGTGKTLIAERLARHLGLSHVRDEWDGRQKTFTAVDTLHIADDLPDWAVSGRRVLHIEQAREVMRGAPQ